VPATAEITGGKMTYSDIGTGLPLICLHGGMGVDARSLWVPGILNLAGFGIRLIIPDQRGHGQSPGGGNADYTHARWVADVRELATHLGLSRFALLGHSYGGFLVLEFAVRWPQSLTHLVLVGTSAGPVRASTRTFTTDSELREFFRGVWPFLFVGDNKHWELFDAVRFHAAPYNAAFSRELPAYDVRDRIAAINVPMLLIVGRHDAYLPHMEWLASHAKKATLCVIEGVGHFPFVEAPDKFLNAVASFLSEVQPGSAELSSKAGSEQEA
jgi:proline iminopeptidase